MGTSKSTIYKGFDAFLYCKKHMECRKFHMVFQDQVSRYCAIILRVKKPSCQGRHAVKPKTYSESSTEITRQMI
jgi:hypothetical protein